MLGAVFNYVTKERKGVGWSEIPYGYMGKPITKKERSQNR